MPTAKNCTFIRSLGVYCGSTAVRGEDLCFYHLRDRRREESLARSMAARHGWIKRALEDQVDLNDSGHVAAKEALTDELFLALELPPFEDANAIQEATTAIFRAVATGQVTETRAKRLFSFLNLAHKNIDRVRFQPVFGEELATDVPDGTASLAGDMTGALLEEGDVGSEWNENNEAALEPAEEGFGEVHIPDATASNSQEPVPSSTTT